jgi:double-stranded uracil-DNA glycosylase
VSVGATVRRRRRRQSGVTVRCHCPDASHTIGAMHSDTLAIYEARGLEWAGSHADPVHRAEAEAFSARVAGRGLRLDLGCGAGRYLPFLGEPVIGLDACRSMLGAARVAAPGTALVQADIEWLPLARGSITGAWSWMTHLHLPRHELPLALWDVHRVLRVGSPFELQVLAGDYEGTALPEDTIGGRYFAGWQPGDLTEVVVGAGFDILPGSLEIDGDEVRLAAVRGRTLADTVGRDMRLLVCGVNPAIYSADVGVGYGRPGNRFWPAALAAGIVTRDRDPLDALVSHGMGMTDFVKRATRTAAEVTAAEYRHGFVRVERLVRWLEPAAVCFVGLSGWRAAVDPRATAGWQPEGVAGRPAYVMPSTSGLNARIPLSELADHLQAAVAGP